MSQSSTEFNAFRLQYIVLLSLATISILVNVLLLFMTLQAEEYNWQAVTWQDWGELLFHILTSLLLIYFAQLLRKRKLAEEEDV
ncbi:MAG: hypothetical protein ACRBFS_13030 [Aureispira sp.]